MATVQGNNGVARVEVLLANNAFWGAINFWDAWKWSSWDLSLLSRAQGIAQELSDLPPNHGRYHVDSLGKNAIATEEWLHGAIEGL